MCVCAHGRIIDLLSIRVMTMLPQSKAHIPFAACTHPCHSPEEPSCERHHTPAQHPGSGSPGAPGRRPAVIPSGRGSPASSPRSVHTRSAVGVLLATCAPSAAAGERKVQALYFSVYRSPHGCRAPQPPTMGHYHHPREQSQVERNPHQAPSSA